MAWRRIIESDRKYVWSAAPTPFTSDMEIDIGSVKRMVEHHIRLGVTGLFLAGTNGEGPWMTDRQKRTLVQTVVRCNRGRLPLAVQVTDNSAARILDNIAVAKEDGADIAVIASPYFLFNATLKSIMDLYCEVITRSPLPVGIYDMGDRAQIPIPASSLKNLLSQKKVVIVKDSSKNEKRMKIALAAKRKRPDLMLLTGDEFNCIKYIKAGYDGLLLGGGVFNGYIANKIVRAVVDGDLKLAEKLQHRMNRMMYSIYGGKTIKCWLSGEKKLLKEMGIFRTWKSYLNYPLTTACCKDIERTMKTDAEFLLP